MSLLGHATQQTQGEEPNWRSDVAFIESVVQTSDALVAVLDPTGRIVFFNHACERATGYDLQQVYGRYIWTLLIAPEERLAVKRVFMRILVGDFPNRYENDWIHKNESRIRVSWSNTALTEPDGDVRYVVATGTNITELRRAEDELRRSQERAEALFETAAQAILTVGADGRILAANESASQMFGYAREELQGLQLEDLVPARFRQRHAESRREFHQAPRRRPMGEGMDLLALRQDGSEFPVEIGLSYVHSADGLTAVAFISDVSERVAAREAVEAGSRRVQALASQLIVAQEEERRSIARDLHDDFTHRLALQSIELGLLQKELSQDHPQWGQRLAALQEETLALTEEARRLSHELHPAALEHCGIVTALEMQCSEFSKSSGIQVSFVARDVDDSVPRELSAGLYRICQEALRNARKHSGAKTVRVYLSSSEDSLRLAVVDDGSGFDLGGVRAEGTGVGLTSIEERARMLGGDFQVQSVPDEGARIEVRIPMPGAES